jgi:hypothetical protein
MSKKDRFWYVVYLEPVTNAPKTSNMRGNVGVVYETRLEAEKMARDMERVLKNEMGEDYDVWVGRIYRRGEIEV